jgi:hypothetical protein
VIFKTTEDRLACCTLLAAVYVICSLSPGTVSFNYFNAMLVIQL